MNSRFINRIILFLNWAGIFVAANLSLTYIGGNSLFCDQRYDCYALTLNPESKWIGVPIALYGLVFYVTLTAISYLKISLENRAKQLQLLSTVLSTFGAITSCYLMYVMTVKLKFICPLCITSAVILLITASIHLSQLKYSGKTAKRTILDETIFFGLMIATIGITAVNFVNQTRAIAKIEAQIKIEKIPPLEKILPPEKRILGSKNAAVTVLQFADLFCKPCQIHFGKLKQKVIDTQGKLRIGYCYFPLGKPKSVKYHAALLCEQCQTKQKFWQAIDTFHHVKFNEKPNAETLSNFALTHNLDETDLEICTHAEKSVQKDIKFAKDIGINFTPTFIIFAENQTPKIATSATIEYILNNSPYSDLLKKQ